MIAAFGYWAVLILGGKNMVGAYPLAVIQSITIYTWLIVGCYINFVFIPKNRYNLVATNQFVAMVSFLLLAVCSLLFYKNVIIIVSAFAISHIAEIIYCRDAVRRHKLLD